MTNIPEITAEDLTMEMATVCDIKEHQLGIQIIIRSQNHGTMDPLYFISSKRSPAHAHVYGTTLNDFVGRLNITGPCPKNLEDIYEYLEGNDDGKQSKFTRDVRKKIVKWANMPSPILGPNMPKTTWEWAQIMWTGTRFPKQ